MLAYILIVTLITAEDYLRLTAYTIEVESKETCERVAKEIRGRYNSALAIGQNGAALVVTQCVDRR